MTQASSAMAQATFTPAPIEGLMESIPVTGIVIDYDYARKVGTAMEKTSVRPFPEIFCLDIDFFFYFRVPCLSCRFPLWTKKIVANISTLRLMTLSRFSTRLLASSPSPQDLVAKSVRGPIMFLLQDGTMRLIVSSYARIKPSI